MVKFFSAYDYPINSYEVKCKESTLGYFHDSDGLVKFGVVGERDVQSDINRHKDSCDYAILKAYLYSNGVLKDVGEYGERPLPVSDVNDIGAMLSQAQELYEKLPDFVKVKYRSVEEVLKASDADVKKLFDDMSNNSNNNKDNIVVSAKSKDGGKSNEE